jgi:hypothetical protein
MKGHGNFSVDDRAESFEEARQEIQGRLPKGQFEFSPELKFDSIKVSDTDPPVVARFKRALIRDCRYSTAGSPYIRAFGMSQALRSIYEGAKQLVDGGAK